MHSIIYQHALYWFSNSWNNLWNVRILRTKQTHFYSVKPMPLVVSVIMETAKDVLSTRCHLVDLGIFRNRWILAINQCINTVSNVTCGHECCHAKEQFSDRLKISQFPGFGLLRVWKCWCLFESIYYDDFN